MFGLGRGAVTSEALHFPLHRALAPLSVLGTTPFPVHRPHLGASQLTRPLCLGWWWALEALQPWSHGPSLHALVCPRGVEEGGPVGTSGYRQSSPFPLQTLWGGAWGDEDQLSRWGRLAAGGSPATLYPSQGNYR